MRSLCVSKSLTHRALDAHDQRQEKIARRALQEKVQSFFQCFGERAEGYDEKYFYHSGLIFVPRGTDAMGPPYYFDVVGVCLKCDGHIVIDGNSAYDLPSLGDVIESLREHIYCEKCLIELRSDAENTLVMVHNAG